MASISSDSSGYRRLLFKQGKRYTIHLGRIPIKTAREIKTRVESIQAALTANHPLDGMTALWLSGIDDALHAKLAKTGIVSPRVQRGSTQLITLVDELHAKLKKTWKKNTILNHRIARRHLLDYFGNSRDVTKVTEAEAEAYRDHLGTLFAENTVRRWCSYARQYFKAFAKKLGFESPFSNMRKLSVDSVPDRLYFIDEALAYRVLNAMPDLEWKLIFALCRWGGFRCPSEHNALRWRDIDWDRKRISLHAPKTGLRTLPLFPELEAILKQMKQKGVNENERVFEYQDNINLSKEFKRFLTIAGITPWPKIFQNLRSTRETELLERFPLQVVCSWIGNTEAVARKHYLQTTDEHYERATARKATQQLPETNREHKQLVSTFAKNSVGFSNLLVLSAAKLLPIGVQERSKSAHLCRVYLKPSRKATH